MRDGNYFFGAHPIALRKFLLADPGVAKMVDSVRMIEPWVWTFDEDTSFLVGGLSWVTYPGLRCLLARFDPRYFHRTVLVGRLPRVRIESGKG